MKNYDETIRSVLDRIHAYKTEQTRRRRATVKIAAMCGMCLIVLAGLVAWQGGMFETERQTVSVPDNTGGDTNTNGTETAENPASAVIWGNEPDETQDAGIVEWNGKSVSCALYDVLRDADKDAEIAVSLFFTPDETYLYNGKPLAEYAAEKEAEAENERQYRDRLAGILKLGDLLKYGDALYTTGTPDGEVWAKELYENYVVFFGDLLEKYVVNGEFLREKAEADLAAYDARHDGTHDAKDDGAYKAGCNAYYQFIIESAIRQLTAQKIRYERTAAPNRLTVFTTAADFPSLTVESVSYFDLATRNPQDTDDTALVTPAQG